MGRLAHRPSPPRQKAPSGAFCRFWAPHGRPAGSHPEDAGRSARDPPTSLSSSQVRVPKEFRLTASASDAPLLKFDPRQIPVVRRDHHLPAVPGERLQADWLRHHLTHQPVWQPEQSQDLRLVDRAPRQAAVLVPIVARPEPTVLLTQRATHLKHHPGQISFPGGAAEPADSGPVATALREAHEEIGLPAHEVEVLGTMPLYTTATQFQVRPVLGWVRPDVPLQWDEGEVESAFEVPLAFLMDPRHHERREGTHEGLTRGFFAMPWHDPQGRERFIWGATAAMLRNLYRLMLASR